MYGRKAASLDSFELLLVWERKYSCEQLPSWAIDKYEKDGLQSFASGYDMPWERGVQTLIGRRHPRRAKWSWRWDSNQETSARLNICVSFSIGVAFSVYVKVTYGFKYAFRLYVPCFIWVLPVGIREQRKVLCLFTCPLTSNLHKQPDCRLTGSQG